MLCDMLERIGESEVKEMQERRNAGEEERLWSSSQLELAPVRFGCCVIDIPLQKAVSRAQFLIFSQNSFFAELEILRTTFPSKKLGNRCINQLMRAI